MRSGDLQETQRGYWITYFEKLSEHIEANRNNIMTDIETINQMKETHPIVGEIIDTLHLQAPRQDVPDDVRKKLSNIADRLFTKGRIYTQKQIVEMIRTGLNVSSERAEKGFSMMYDSGVLSQSLSGGFRLSVIM